MPSLILSGTTPKPYLLTGLPTAYTVTPILSRPVITMLSGADLPIGDADALENAGAYLIVREKYGAAPTVYVGEGGLLEQRLTGHARLRPNSGSVFVIAVTAERGDLAKPDVGTLERLIYLGLAAETGIELGNLDEPSHSPVEQTRFEQLCAYTADVLTRIGQSGLLPLAGRWREALSGLSLCAELLVEPSLEALVGAQRKRVQGGGYQAEALFLADGRCLLKRGSRIRSTTTDSIPTRPAIHRQEALFAGLVVERDGAFFVTRDLLFENSTQISCFITGSTCGRWKTATEPKAEAQAKSSAWLTLWREASPQACTETDATSLRMALAGTALLGEPDWPRAVNGDIKAAVQAALRVTNPLQRDPAATGALDLVMTALMACAIDQTPSAADVFDMLLFRLKAKGLSIAAPIKLGFGS
ncbi:DUF4357 domain-containing protein [Chelatococcus sambhunathii]|uniref:DUF4357 domain-containing protein n=1 Tax=Chelatococcus sambhunathii TaxID=363953 RepID=A0ABU1DGG3_9HYPH|nr:DUF4357 domain-containing protein [Chelatococcus sambhunathii]MDR4307177.1 DUF4357 domain-containing protein [Chelatococcus sambhunathii]